MARRTPSLGVRAIAIVLHCDICATNPAADLATLHACSSRSFPPKDLARRLRAFFFAPLRYVRKPTARNVDVKF
jgi:hypothetical protein